ncbi:MAG: methyltransferase, partial [Flavobacteriales bacterium]|nr:methyltransferase [Flavobacteriales bacterium]
QAPYEVYKKALQNNYKVYERVDTIVCLIKS